MHACIATDLPPSVRKDARSIVTPHPPPRPAIDGPDDQRTRQENNACGSHRIHHRSLHHRHADDGDEAGDIASLQTGGGLVIGSEGHGASTAAGEANRYVPRGSCREFRRGVVICSGARWVQFGSAGPCVVGHCPWAIVSWVMCVRACVHEWVHEWVH
jgi:hypothetical protein